MHDSRAGFGPLSPPSRSNSSEEAGVTDRKNKAFRFFVSEDFIEIAADAIAVQTKRNCRFSTLRWALETCCTRMPPGQFDADDFDIFSRTTPLDGDIRIHLNMHASWSPRYEELKAKLSEIAGKRIFDRTAIAYLLHTAVKMDLY
jgi:hypothetical protein